MTYDICHMLLYPNDRLMEFFSLANKLESQKFNFSDPRSKEYIVHTTKLELFCIVIFANQKDVIYEAIHYYYSITLLTTLC